MRKEYDFSKVVKNPYTDKTKRLISILLDNENIDYFKKLSLELNVPYQTLIDSYLSDCVAKKLKPKTNWS